MKAELFSYCLSSASWRVRIALAHKQLPYEVRPVNLKRGNQLEATHADVHPLQQVPVLRLHEDDGRVLSLTQSMAICEYLEERWPDSPLLPRSREGRAHVRAMAETINAGIQPLQNLYVRLRVRNELDGDDVAWTVHFIRRGLEALEKLAAPHTGPFLHGSEPTLADVFLLPQLFSARRLEMDTSAYARLSRAEQACESLETWQAAHPKRQPDWESSS